MFIPYQVDVPMARWPLANWALMAVTIGISIALFGQVERWQAEAVILSYANMPMPEAEGPLRYFLMQPEHFHPLQLVGSAFAHMGWLHLLGNMLFLWVFGNAINAKLGHLQYIGFYLLCSVCEGTVWYFLGPAPALGASGAIMGVVGAFLMLYPLNDISCVLLWGWIVRLVEFSSGWLIALYVAFDVWGAMFKRHAGVGYLAHVAGFAAGAGVITLLLVTKWLEPTNQERTLLQAAGLMPEPEDELISKPRPVAVKPRVMSRAEEPAWMQAAGARPAKPPRKPKDEGPIPLD